MVVVVEVVSFAGGGLRQWVNNRGDEVFHSFETEWQIKIQTQESLRGGGRAQGRYNRGLEHLIMLENKELL